ncbi:DegT/DnrJ/EryC1/StrS family aminotransferase [Rhodococcus sp. BP-241]|uniref:DegT/DnrJ/EryC1/StrS family aminotransferase n=1 Tax=unclassified Rhodococcus (in: high G+C Gram-positive bacteria) TaxID=192944 RepID=UPI000700C91A|nr:MULTISPECIES: DegT/DnrJ/EryC1/StrS family aminotransferase [unclassified Rhodococcus (in: high G+C Gram-positive bacteria)]KQU36099.1 erythromycin biosynthesis sensory transduction protein eryC1 [Rhodococcus sp. Leaf225]KQU48647.1 erythromycin biosynthesis sensory transduction protein eryC1 [Rhodococcus sp. Leaf258]MBY6707201.1 DegT/DnrJ/EryC1/StrS family aminotransferase [Rhodococcus sp. BP-241]
MTTVDQSIAAVRPAGGPIPLVDLGAQISEIRDELWPALRRVVDDTAFIGGSPVREFESAYADYLGSTHCIGVANGTDALEIALRSVGVGPGDEVVVPANSFVASAEAVERIGAVTVFADVDPDHLLLDPASCAEVLTPRTRAIVPVHLFGQVAPVEDLVSSCARAGISIVEDCAQAQGARRGGRTAGTLGDVSATSFYPGKNLGAVGDAGAVVTSNDEVARTARMLGAHGSVAKYHHEILGFNSRLDAVQAVVLSLKLSRLDDWNTRRRSAAARYEQMLADVPEVVTPQSASGNDDVWHLYVVRVQDRDRVVTRLGELGIGAGVHYPVPLHLTPALAHRGRGVGAHPVAEAAAGEILSLPLHPHITEQQQQTVVAALVSAIRGSS